MLAQRIIDPLLVPEYCSAVERASVPIMRIFTSSRFQQLRASRLVIAILGLGLLGFSIAPCHAMAQHQHPGTSHHGSIPAGDCGHCPDTPSSLDRGCATAAATDCASVGPAVLERQGIEVPQPAAAAPPAFPDINPFPPDDGPVRDMRARDLPAPHVSIQQRYCSYLN
ncbi:MAG: hypothetical protein WBO00_06290 [Steroidobacteraceae bacterium]